MGMSVHILSHDTENTAINWLLRGLTIELDPLKAPAYLTEALTAHVFARCYVFLEVRVLIQILLKKVKVEIQTYLMSFLHLYHKSHNVAQLNIRSEQPLSSINC